jgi:hypothetical protein
MAEDGHAAPSAPGAPAAPSAGHAVTAGTEPQRLNARNLTLNANGPALEEIASLTSPRLYTPNPFSRKNTSLDIDDYFVRITRSPYLLP